METGSISDKIGRGKHTTRHSEVFVLDDDSYILDTPGFTSLSVMVEDKTDLDSICLSLVSMRVNADSPGAYM